ncbi:MAG TPA: hypothetical protein DCM73_15850 [Clostridiales bacterium]|nr:hypothetical protein [Clostridiales bacterium]
MFQVLADAMTMLWEQAKTVNALTMFWEQVEEIDAGTPANGIAATLKLLQQFQDKNNGQFKLLIFLLNIVLILYYFIFHEIFISLFF